MQNLITKNLLALRLKQVLKISAYLIAPSLGAQAQSSNAAVSDTLQGSDSVIITANAFNLAAAQLSASTVKIEKLQVLQPGNLVPILNTMPGVRMEERSPGSYRLNLRGSSLRSPFGVRNVKMYWNGIPFTDASGNTYFNQVDAGTITQIQVLRGPAGSMYGAGAGGAVLMQSAAGASTPFIDLTTRAGTFKTGYLHLSFSPGSADNKQRITYSRLVSDGYRAQSLMQRHQASYTGNIVAANRTSLTASLLYTNLYYQTPGGLTQKEYGDNPRAARPAAGAFPSAEAVNAAIWQQNILAGLQLQQTINKNWKNISAAYASVALIENSAIRNYEERSEPQAGARTNFIYEKRYQNLLLNWQTGGEYQAGWFNTQVSRNKNGQRDSTLTNDDLRFYTGFVFTQLNLRWQKFAATVGTSLNKSDVTITRFSRLPVKKQKAEFGTEWAPRVQLVYEWSKSLLTQLTVSRGFSPPTSGELLPGNGDINTSLKAESGINYELAQRILISQRLWFSVNAFHFKLNNALVQQRDASGGDFFINAGKTKQEGIEAAINTFLTSGLLQTKVDAAYTYSQYRFSNYNKGGVDLSGNKIPGVPSHTVAVSAGIGVKEITTLNISYYFNSAIPLNDGNTAEAKPFHVFSTALQQRLVKNEKLFLLLDAGVDNAFDTVYSLGNDINAAGGRYFNAASARRFFAGFRIQWSRPKKQI